MGHAGDQLSDGRHFFALQQLFLGLAEIFVGAAGLFIETDLLNGGGELAADRDQKDFSSLLEYSYPIWLHSPMMPTGLSLPQNRTQSQERSASERRNSANLRPASGGDIRR